MLLLSGKYLRKSLILMMDIIFAYEMLQQAFRRIFGNKWALIAWKQAIKGPYSIHKTTKQSASNQRAIEM
jgi:hypothetical protein